MAGLSDTCFVSLSQVDSLSSCSDLGQGVLSSCSKVFSLLSGVGRAQVPLGAWAEVMGAAQDTAPLDVG